jgi:hypothetical protein
MHGVGEVQEDGSQLYKLSEARSAQVLGAGFARGRRGLINNQNVLDETILCVGQRLHIPQKD